MHVHHWFSQIVKNWLRNSGFKLHVKHELLNIVLHLTSRWNGPYILSWWLFQVFVGNSSLTLCSEIPPTTTKHFKLLNWFRPPNTAVFWTVQPTAWRIKRVNPQCSTRTHVFVSFYLFKWKQSQTQHQRTPLDGCILRGWSVQVGIFRLNFFKITCRIDITIFFYNARVNSNSNKLTNTYHISEVFGFFFACWLSENLRESSMYH